MNKKNKKNTLFSYIRKILGYTIFIIASLFIIFISLIFMLSLGIEQFVNGFFNNFNLVNICIGFIRSTLGTLISLFFGLSLAILGLSISID